MFLNLTIHGVYSAVAARSPEGIAVVGDGEPVRYADLARRSDRIARYLRARGVAPGARIGLYAQRSADSVAAMLGILKAGAAYVPFDPTYPHMLLRYIYQDCAPTLLFAQQSLLDERAGPPFWDSETIDIGAEFADASSNGLALPLVRGPA